MTPHHGGLLSLRWTRRRSAVPRASVFRKTTGAVFAVLQPRCHLSLPLWRRAIFMCIPVRSPRWERRILRRRAAVALRSPTRRVRVASATHRWRAGVALARRCRRERVAQVSRRCRAAGASLSPTGRFRAKTPLLVQQIQQMVAPFTRSSGAERRTTRPPPHRGALFRGFGHFSELCRLQEPLGVQRCHAARARRRHRLAIDLVLYVAASEHALDAGAWSIRSRRGHSRRRRDQGARGTARSPDDARSRRSRPAPPAANARRSRYRAGRARRGPRSHRRRRIRELRWFQMILIAGCANNRSCRIFSARSESRRWISVHVVAMVGEVQRFLDRGVAAADHRHLLAAIEEAVAPSRRR